MSWYIHHCGEMSNRSYCEIFEADILGEPRYPGVIGPFDTEEQAEKAAERRGLSLTSLRDLKK